MVPPINYNSKNPKEYSLQTVTYNRQTDTTLTVPGCDFNNAREYAYDIRWQDFGISPELLSSMSGH